MYIIIHVYHDMYVIQKSADKCKFCVSMSVCIGNLPKKCLKWNISLLSMCSNLRFQDLHSLIISGPEGTKFSFQLKSNYNTQGPAEQSTYGSITGVGLNAKIIENPWAWGWQYNVFSVKRGKVVRC